MVATEENELKQMMRWFLTNSPYRASSCNEYTNQVLEKCKILLERDYKVVEISNANGQLCNGYPSRLFLLENEIKHGDSNKIANTIFESQYDGTSLKNQMTACRAARCRARFPIPVILYKGKNVCRSSTLSRGPEMYTRYLNPLGESVVWPKLSEAVDDKGEDVDDVPMPHVDSPSMWNGDLQDCIRNQDIELLKKLNVGTIVDLMVENCKRKYGVYVTSSEKADNTNRYSKFTLVTLPYPGCEFFKDYVDGNRKAKRLMFDWNQPQYDAVLDIPKRPFNTDLKINWLEYKEWDLLTISQNYLRYLLKYIQESNSGILIHCISGWDRTPLFCSLLRLSLWADGVIHQSLNEFEILYLTIAYDWMLMGHALKDRLCKDEEIFFFCFYMLKKIRHDDFSVLKHKTKADKAEKIAVEKAPKQSEKTAKQPEKSAKQADLDRSPQTVFRTDSELQLDSMKDAENGSLRGSNQSLNSNHSAASTRSQDVPAFAQDTNSNERISLDGFTMINNERTNSDGSAVEANGNGTCNQNKKTSPVSVPTKMRPRQDSTGSGSWQHVTATGSLRSNTHSEDMIDFFPTEREIRLHKVRKLFYNVYFQARAIPYTTSSYTARLNCLLERIGLSSRS